MMGNVVYMVYPEFCLKEFPQRGPEMIPILQSCRDTVSGSGVLG